MSSLASLNVSLPKSLKEYIEATAEQAGYSTPSEYIRELMRDDQKRRATERLEKLLLEGIESGPAVEADEKYWLDLRSDLKKRVQRKKRK